MTGGKLSVILMRIHTWVHLKKLRTVTEHMVLMKLC